MSQLTRSRILHDRVTYREFHALRTSSSELAADNDFTPLGAALHDES